MGFLVLIDYSVFYFIDMRETGERFLLILALIIVIEGKEHCPPKCQCDKKLTTVNCEGQSLIEIPENIPMSVEKLYLDHNSLTVLPPHGFSKLSNLKMMYLRNNKLSSIQANAFTGLIALNYLFMDTNNIEAFDPLAFHGASMITHLFLSANQFKVIPDLAGLISLEELVMEGNSITNATFPSSFIDIKDLSTIILSSSNIKALTDDTFKMLEKSGLRKLEISRNEIDSISPNAFSPLTNLASLKIGYNPISSFMLNDALQGLQTKTFVSLDISSLALGNSFSSKTLHNLQNSSLSSLKMQNNNIPVLPSFSFQYLNNLITLDISGCKILTAEDQAFMGLSKLTKLNINFNRLTEVPRNFPSSLQTLYLSGNDITRIHGNIFHNLTSLHELSLGDNKIQTLQQTSFTGLVRLRTLKLENNQIATLPGKLFNSLVSLVSMDISKNRIQRIPFGPDLFSNTPSLQYLNMADNLCFSLPFDIFNQMQSLIYLHLENNKIGQIIKNDVTGKLFSGLNGLKQLFLSGNSINVLPSTTFQGVVSLTNLDLHQNHISHWAGLTFANASLLTEIDLSHNLISLINQTSFDHLKSLTTLNLAGNPFSCTCDLRWFRNWIKSATVKLPFVRSYTCNTPEKWQGKPLLSFDETKIDCFNYAYIYIPGIFVVWSLITLVLYNKRWFLMLRLFKIVRKAKALRRMNNDYQPIEGENVKFDAFISYHEDDEEWVQRNLLPGLDVKNNGEFKIYFYARDFKLGRFQISDIIENMTASRKVLVVLSHNYCHTRRRIYELDYALQIECEKEIEGIVVVKLPSVHAKDIPKLLKSRMERHLFIEWADNDDAQEHLIERLKVKLKERPVNALHV